MRQASGEMELDPLSEQDMDAEVRQRGILCWKMLLFGSGLVMVGDGNECWQG